MQNMQLYATLRLHQNHFEEFEGCTSIAVSINASITTYGNEPLEFCRFKESESHVWRASFPTLNLL